MKAVLDHTHHEADNIVTFWWRPEKPIDYIAGQYIEMTIPHERPDERGIKHWFTLSSSPTDAPLVSNTTKFAEKSSTFKTALRKLQPGDSVGMTEAMGDFVLPKDPAIPLVFVAGGIGLTPYHSMIKWLYDTHQERDITFLYAVSNEHEIIFQALFDKYGMKRIIVVNEPQGEWDGETGRLTGSRILELTKPADDALIYVSGPEPMVEALEADLEKHGLPKDRFVGDFFPGYQPI